MVKNSGNIVYNDNDCQIVRINFDEFCDDYENIIDAITPIFGSQETEISGTPEQAKKQLYEMIGEHLGANDDSQMYILLTKENGTLIPVSLVTYTRNDATFHLKYIITHSDYTCLGYASKLMVNSFKDLKRNFDIDDIYLQVNDKNFASQNLQNAVSKYPGIKTYMTRYDQGDVYIFGLKNLICDELLNEDHCA